MGTCACRPVRLKSSSINSSDTSAKYSWPNKEQKEEIQDSGEPEELDIVANRVRGCLRRRRGRRRDVDRCGLDGGGVSDAPWSEIGSEAVVGMIGGPVGSSGSWVLSWFGSLPGLWLPARLVRCSSFYDAGMIKRTRGCAASPEMGKRYNV